MKAKDLKQWAIGLDDDMIVQIETSGSAWVVRKCWVPLTPDRIGAVSKPKVEEQGPS